MRNHKRTGYRVRKMGNRWFILWYGGKGDIELGCDDYASFDKAKEYADRSNLWDFDRGPNPNG